MLNLSKRGFGLISMIKAEDKKALVSEYIKRLMIALGPAVALAKARNVTQIDVDDDGSVHGLSGDFDETLHRLAGEYEVLIGEAAYDILLRLQDKDSKKDQGEALHV